MLYVNGIIFVRNMNGVMDFQIITFKLHDIVTKHLNLIHIGQYISYRPMKVYRPRTLSSVAMLSSDQ